MVEIRFSLLAEEDLNHIYDYISEDSEYYARLFIESVLSRIQVLRRQPQIGKVVPELNEDQTRELVFRKYRIIYFVLDESTVVVIRVIHGSKLLDL